MEPKQITILGFEGAMALDIVGPFDAFSIATRNTEHSEPQPCYQVAVVELAGLPFTTESGLMLVPQTKAGSVQAIDTLIVPGGVGLRKPHIQAAVSAWISSMAPRIRRIATVCTGVYGVAPTGLLDGLRVTTHWRHADDLATNFPLLKVDPAALFCKQGKMYTCAGITAGIDLSLALIEEDYGPSVSLAVARELVVYLKRSGGQDQYSESLRFQAKSPERFADLIAWMRGNVHRPLSVESLAEHVHMSPRQFSRSFTEAFESTPAAYLAELRLNEAKARLLVLSNSIEQVGDSVGFRSPDVFRRAFERRFGVSPRTYRTRFGSNLAE